MDKIPNWFSFKDGILKSLRWFAKRGTIKKANAANGNQIQSAA